MKIHVVRGKAEEAVEVGEGSTSLEVFEHLGLLPDAHLVLRGGTPIPLDEPLLVGQTIRIVKVASGG